MSIRSLGLSASLLVMGLLVPSPGTAQSAANSPGELRVVSYNIRAGLGLNLPPEITPADHLDMLADYLIKLDADIYLLQEVDRNVRRSGNRDQPEVLADALGAFHAHYTKAIDLQGGEYGVAILSRWPITDTQDHLLFRPDYSDRTDIPAYFAEQRVFQVALVDSPFGPIPVGNTHLGLTAEQRELQIAGMVEAITAIGADVAWIVGGDLNGVPDAPEQGALRAILRDVFEGREDSQLSTTIPVDQRYTFRSDRPDRCIDYILVADAHWDVKQTDVPLSTMSDHLPVVTVLTPRRAAQTAP